MYRIIGIKGLSDERALRRKAKKIPLILQILSKREIK
jgi:hypothetical protein